MKFLKFPLILLAFTALFFTACDKDDEIDLDLRDVDLFTSSNTSGTIETYDFSEINDDDDMTVTSKSNTVPYADADGIYYDDSNDRLIQVSRTDNRVYAYNDFKDLADGAAATPSLSGPEGAFTNARGITFGRNRVIVAQDGNDANNNENKIIIFNVEDDRITLRNTYTVDFNLWGVHVEDETLYAIEDNSNRVAVFNEIFDNLDGAITPSKVVAIEGIVRTHGLHFSDAIGEDLMILTDVGSADSDNDGKIIFIEDFDDLLDNTENNGTIALSEQMVISGQNTQLGNPVDVEWDHLQNQVFVAERKRDGGLVLVFDMPENTGTTSPTPIFSRASPGIASVALDLGL